MVYKLAFPPHLSIFHPIFHISLLKRYCPDNARVIQWDFAVLDHDLSFEKESIIVLGI